MALYILTLFGHAQAKELVIGVEGIEYFPIYAKKDGEYKGFAREFFDAFATYSGHTITYKPMPIKRLYHEFLNGRVDLKFPDSAYWKSDEKKGKNVLYSANILDYIDGVMVLPSNISKGKERLKKLGTVRGFTPWDYIGEVKSGVIKVHESTDLMGLVKLVKAGRIDGVYFNVSVARYFLKHTLFEEGTIQFDESLPHSRGAYQASTINHPDILEELNTFLSEKAVMIETMKKKYEVKL